MTDEQQRDPVVRGATPTWFEVLALPGHFGDPGREWRAAREGAAVFPAGYRRHIVAVGDDRVSFLHGMLTNDIQGLTAGSGCHAALLDERARVITDLRVYAADTQLSLDVLAWRADVLRERLDRFIIADDVELRETDELQPLVQVQGPLAAAVAREALGADVLPAARFGHQRLTFNGLAVGVARVSEIDDQGMSVWGPVAARVALLDACVEAGAVRAGMLTLDVLRIEAGIPWPGIDTDDSTLIMEMDLASAISSSKGCYLGQEVVERVRARGHVNRHLCGLVLEGGDVPARATPLLAGEREVGHVTSAAHSPLVGGVIALGIIHRKHATPGTQVRVGAERTPATVAALPFDPGAQS